MEEVRSSSNPEDGQLNEELPEPLSIPHESLPTSSPTTNTYESTAPRQSIAQEHVSHPNTSSLRNSNLEATYDINTLPRPVETNPQTAYPEQATSQEVPEVHEADFDKRNERLRDVPRQQDELAAAGMVALGDVLKDRQTAYAAPVSSAPPTPRPAQLPLNPPTNTTASGWSLYKQAIVIGLVTGLIMAPVIIVALVRG